MVSRKLIGFLDYLTMELDKTFNSGRQVWEDKYNYEAKRILVMEAIERAKKKYDSQKETELQ